jgi:hypothetical protein
MTARIALCLLGACLGFARLSAEPVSKREVLAAIAVMEKDVTSTDALRAADLVTRFGKESESVMITIGTENMPWVQLDIPEKEAPVRALLMAAYFAGNIKAQLQKHRPADDPYSGWIATISAYRQIRKKQPDMVIPEIEELIKKEETGTLKEEAEELRFQQEQEQRKDSKPNNMV